MNNQKQRQAAYRLHASLATLVLATVMLPPIPIANARTIRPTLKGCNGELLLLPTHPDVEALQQLYERYVGFIPNTTELGMTRRDFAQVVSTLAARMDTLKPSADSTQVRPQDGATLRRLQRAYAQDIALLQKQEHLSTREQRKFDRRFSNTPSGRMSPSVLPPPPSPASTGLNRTMVQSEGAVPSAVVPVRPQRPNDGPMFGDRDRLHPPGTFNTEDYNRINENPFQRPLNSPLSTFSIDVDTASYSNVRRFIRQGQLPPKDAVRVEELINYFPYDYPQPQGDRPFSVTTEVTRAPWNTQHKLVQIGLKGKQLQTIQPSNLVFLVDVSGSMKRPHKLDLVKKSLCLLTEQLSPQDRVSLVVYAGHAGVVLPPTPGNHKAQIMATLDRLEAGGSTAGAAGIELAYQMAQKNLLNNGNNRVILATDGDFNVGVSSNAGLERLIASKRDQGIFLTVLGFGTGNYKDTKMELLADQGNGNYAYLDTLLEAQKVLVNDLRSTLFTIAKDVKIQVEFNPAKVQAYRLIGYENRLLRAQDFNDDRKDAGDIGAGHTVTALYEIIPTGLTPVVTLPEIDPLKYQQVTNPTTASNRNELMHVKLRYKAPNGAKSRLISQPIADHSTPVKTASENLKFASAVAMYGMVLRSSDYKGNATYKRVLELASQGLGGDREGYRQAFIQLVQRSQRLSQKAGD